MPETSRPGRFSTISGHDILKEELRPLGHMHGLQEIALWRGSGVCWGLHRQKRGPRVRPRPTHSMQIQDRGTMTFTMPNKLVRKY